MRCGAFHRVEGTLCLVRHGQAALSGSKTKPPGFAGGYLLMAEEYFPGIAASIVASDKTIAEKPELVAKIVHPVLRTMTEIMVDTDGAIAEFTQAVPAMADKKDFVTTVIKSYARDVFPGQPHPGEMNPDRLKVIRDFYVAQGIVTKSTPLEELYTNAFVPK
jgi:NitT/TauT family transport system substrate-binding protein